MADCEDYDVIVPHKKKLHLKWCLLDDEVKDFTKEVTETEGGGPPEDAKGENRIIDSNVNDDIYNIDEVNEVAGNDSIASKIKGRKNEVPEKAESNLLEKFPFQIDLRKRNASE